MGLSAYIPSNFYSYYTFRSSPKDALEKRALKQKRGNAREGTKQAASSVHNCQVQAVVSIDQDATTYLLVALRWA